MNRTPKTVEFWRGDLPHWQVEDGRYFVTVHLAGAIPLMGQARIRQIAAQLNSRADSDEHLRISRLVFREMERWLDRTSAANHLNHPQVAEMMMEAIEHRAHQRIWEMHAYVVMPSHMHMFFDLAEEARLKSVLESFKRWTGHQAGKLIGLNGPRFWQTEWFDHWSRSDEQDERIVDYIRNNPKKRVLWPTSKIGPMHRGRSVGRASRAQPRLWSRSARVTHVPRDLLAAALVTLGSLSRTRLWVTTSR